MAENDVKIIQDAGAGIPRSRTIQTLNAITDAASFRSAFGIGTGTGDVTSVNNITPDGTGDVSLSPGDIGAFAAADAGTIAGLAAPATQDLAATTAIPSTPAPFEFGYYKTLSGALTLTDSGGPTEGTGYSLTLIGDSTNRLITIPSSYSEAQGGNITTFYVLANQQVTIVRRYVNSTWRVYGDPAPAALTQGINIQRALGNSSVVETMPIYSATSNSTLTGGNVAIIAIHIPRVMVVTGAKWFHVNNPSFTQTANNKIGLYSYDGAGGITLVASTNDTPLMWNQSPLTWQTRAFVTPYTATPGIYFFAALYNWTTAHATDPQIAAAPALASSVLNQPTDLTNSALLAGNRSGQSDLPNTDVLSNYTPTTSLRYIRLYT